MVDPLTAAGAGLAVVGSKDLLNKLLGPTAEYVGGEMKGLVEKCNLNIDRIFQNATAKLGDRIDKPGVVSPRLLKHVVDDGKFCEDELAAEYYGGILAASRGDVSRDDRGIAFLAVVKALSVYQLRMHYALYTLWLRHFHGAGLNTGDSNDLEKKVKVVRR